VGSAVYEQFYALEGGQEEVHRRLAYDLDRFVVEVLALVALVADTI
jgi:hypothetical protein